MQLILFDEWRARRIEKRIFFSSQLFIFQKSISRFDERIPFSIRTLKNCKNNYVKKLTFSKTRFTFARSFHVRSQCTTETISSITVLLSKVRNCFCTMLSFRESKIPGNRNCGSRKVNTARGYTHSSKNIINISYLDIPWEDGTNCCYEWIIYNSIPRNFSLLCGKNLFASWFHESLRWVLKKFCKT